MIVGQTDSIIDQSRSILITNHLIEINTNLS